MAEGVHLELGWSWITIAKRGIYFFYITLARNTTPIYTIRGTKNLVLSLIGKSRQKEKLRSNARVPAKNYMVHGPGTTRGWDGVRRYEEVVTFSSFLLSK